MSSSEPKTLFVDSSCVFCDGFARWVLRNTKSTSSLRIAGIEPPVEAYLATRDEKRDAIMLRRGHETDYGAAALLSLAPELKFSSALLVSCARLLPRSLRERAYDWFAARRKQLFGTQETCSLELRDNERFVGPDQ